MADPAHGDGALEGNRQGLDRRARATALAGCFAYRRRLRKSTGWIVCVTRSSTTMTTRLHPGGDQRLRLRRNTLPAPTPNSSSVAGSGVGAVDEALN